MKPSVVCHLMPSVDGRIVLDPWPRGVVWLRYRVIRSGGKRS
jgi:hypothetical protein